MEAWKTINQQDVDWFSTSDLGELVKEFKSYVAVFKCDFLKPFSLAGFIQHLGRQVYD